MKVVQKKNIPKPTHFGKNLKFLRLMKGLSQAKLAKHVDMTRNNMASYESGLVEPNVKNFMKICRFFAVDPKKMLDTILSENPSDITPLDDDTTNVMDQYLSDQLEPFVIQTNEMTKVLEGYQAFYELRKNQTDDISSLELYATLDDLLNLLESLLQENWKLIQSVYPQEEE